jgi:hypothetical protein
MAKEFLASGIATGLSKAEYDAALLAARGEAGFWVNALLFLVHPIVSLLFATLGALVFLGYFRKVDRAVLMDVTTRSLGPAGIIILITGAGGVFKKFLGESGVSDALKQSFEGTGIPVLLLAYVFAVLVRVAQGELGRREWEQQVEPQVFHLRITRVAQELFMLMVVQAAAILQTQLLVAVVYWALEPPVLRVLNSLARLGQ